MKPVYCYAPVLHPQFREKAMNGRTWQFIKLCTSWIKWAQTIFSPFPILQELGITQCDSFRMDTRKLFFTKQVITLWEVHEHRWLSNKVRDIYGDRTISVFEIWWLKRVSLSRPLNICTRRWHQGKLCPFRTMTFREKMFFQERIWLMPKFNSFNTQMKHYNMCGKKKWNNCWLVDRHG